MSFLDKSEKNVKHLFIKEATVGGSVGGFTGRAGMSIDVLFAGPFHPDYNEVEKTLKQQLADRKKQDKDGSQNPIGGYYETDTEFARLAYDELEARNQMAIDYSIENTPPAEIEWKSTGWDYDYDEPGEAYKIKDIVYDDKPTYAGVNFINQSQTNWKIIDRG
jgi:hypothetical protein